ncbi:MAG TPA: putative quinol monooxygenase [Solirubrobacteraceae bacterium]|jgi:quinol monooxygenase YgiN|nr:putative quinol monooxygenase [Solirubrobacteraceae bacterium]
MIVAVGRVVTDAGRREDLKRIGQTVARASRAEAGCLSYRLYGDTENENEFVFVEEWESQEALERHFSTPHIAEFMRAIPSAVAAPPDVKFHTVERTVDLAELRGVA